MAVIPTLNVSVPAPEMPVQVNLKFCVTPESKLLDAGEGAPQFADAVPVGLIVRPGITLSAALPLLVTDAVTVTVSPGFTFVPEGPCALSPEMASATLLTWIERFCVTGGFAGLLLSVTCTVKL